MHTRAEANEQRMRLNHELHRQHAVFIGQLSQEFILDTVITVETDDGPEIVTCRMWSAVDVDRFIARHGKVPA